MGFLLPSLVETIGHTPLLKLPRFGRATPSIALYAKLEFLNPGGSVKDRAVRQILLDSLSDGLLQPGQTLIDSTSGNTGIAYAMLGAYFGIPVQMVMPSNVSKFRRKIIRSYGTEIIDSDPMEGSDGAIHLVRRLIEAHPDTYFYPDQYSNPSNPKAHYFGTGQEILDVLGDRITHFIAGVGTSGTMMGTARRLKEARPSIQCVAVEPDEALHGLEGLKHMPSSLVPSIHDSSRLDRTFRVSTEQGWDTAERICREEGLLVGHSSGANFFAALQIAEELERTGTSGCIVAIACDRGERYFE